MLVDPYTGENVADDDRRQMRLIANRLGEEMDSFYRAARERRELMNLFLYELAGQAPTMPPPSKRTATQERVARCPRCGTRDGERPSPTEFVLRKIEGGDAA